MTQDTMNAEKIANQSLAFIAALESKEIQMDDFKNDAVKTLSEFGIIIPEANIDILIASLEKPFQELEISTDLIGSESWACWSCKVGLAVAIGALEVITIVTIAGVAIFFFPEIAGPVIIAFLASKLAVEITVILVIGVAVIAADILCNEYGPCS